MELPLKDNWEDYLNSYKLEKELKNKNLYIQVPKVTHINFYFCF